MLSGYKEKQLKVDIMYQNFIFNGFLLTDIFKEKV